METTTVSLSDQIAEVKRELALRKNVYKQRVEAGEMEAADARLHFDRLQAVLRTLLALQDLGEGMTLESAPKGQTKHDRRTEHGQQAQAPPPPSDDDEADAMEDLRRQIRSLGTRLYGKERWATMQPGLVRGYSGSDDLESLGHGELAHLLGRLREVEEKQGKSGQPEQLFDE